MSLHTLSMAQALDIWGDLDDAYHGKNGYGGDTAEIYIYRLTSSSPITLSDSDLLSRTFGDVSHEAYASANRALYAILRHYERVRRVHIYLGPSDPQLKRRLGPWLRQAGETHRVHVQVRRTRPKRMEQTT